MGAYDPVLSYVLTILDHTSTHTVANAEVTEIIKADKRIGSNEIEKRFS